MSPKKGKEDLISYQDFNEINSKFNPLPTEDSPGSSGESALTETLMGMEYDEEEDDLDEEEETDEKADEEADEEDNTILADDPAELDDEMEQDE